MPGTSAARALVYAIFWLPVQSFARPPPLPQGAASRRNRSAAGIPASAALVGGMTGRWLRNPIPVGPGQAASSTSQRIGYWEAAADGVLDPSILSF